MTRFFSLRAHPQVRVRGGRDGLSVVAPDPAVDVPVADLPVSPPLDLAPLPADLDEADLARRTAERLAALCSLHRREPRPVAPAQVSKPDVPEVGDLLRAARREATSGLRLLQWQERRRAVRAARAEAERTVVRLHDAAEAARLVAQERVHRAWDLLVHNHEDTVLATLARVFGASGDPVAAVGLRDGDVTLMVLVPEPGVLPDHYPHRSASGDVTLRRVSAGLTSDWYRQLVAGRAVAAARQAFATCPGVETATVVALRVVGDGEHGEDARRVTPVLATRLSRSRLDRLHWEAVTAWDVLEMAGHDTVTHSAGRFGELRPIELNDQPDLAELAAAVDLS